MNIIISNSGGEPIYEQIGSQIKGEILSGALKENEPLPSIRLLAKELRISVITTKRAYEELEREGYIYTVPGKGSFVSGIDIELLHEENLKKVESSLQDALMYAEVCGLSVEALQDMLRLLAED